MTPYFTTSAGHERAITALDIDHSGGRLVTGSADYTVKVYDFNGMKSDFRAFRSVEPAEGHPVHAVRHSILPLHS
jgi:WD40 repeat protein